MVCFLSALVKVALMLVVSTSIDCLGISSTTMISEVFWHRRWYVLQCIGYSSVKPCFIYEILINVAGLVDL